MSEEKLEEKCVSKQDIRYVTLYKYEIVGYRNIPNPVSRRPNGPFQTNHTRYSTPNTNQIDFWFDEDLSYAGRDDTRERITRPNTENVHTTTRTITKNRDTANQIAAAAASATWASAEIARMKYAEITGRNLIPGDRRIFTVWEKVGCQAKFNVTHIDTKIFKSSQYSSCKDAIRFEVIKYIHKKLLRKICDLLGQNTGKPWK